MNVHVNRIARWQAAGGFAPKPTPSPPYPVASDFDPEDDDDDDDDDDGDGDSNNKNDKKENIVSKQKRQEPWTSSTTKTFSAYRRT